MSRFTWYTKGLNKYLSNDGYVHFLTKREVMDDFDDGVAFFIDDESKKFGKCDVVSSDKYAEASKLCDEFKNLIATA